MSEDFRQKLVHEWHMKRLNETLQAIRVDCHLIDRDIEVAKAEAKEWETCMTT